MGAEGTRSITGAWAVAAAAAALLAVTQGFRSSLGLFLSPINTATGLGLATISFALAASQLAAGVAQPLVGRLAERIGNARLIVAGALATAAAVAVLPWLRSAAGLTAGFVAVAVGGTALASAPVLIAAVIARVPPAFRGRASGVVGAGGSAGQLVIGPASQAGIAAIGWTGTLLALSGLTLLCAALARAFRAAPPAAAAGAAAGRDAAAVQAARRVRSQALRDRSFWCLAASFFACGFHVSFLLAHMPGFIESCRLPPSLAGAWLAIIGVCNVAGSLGAGFLVERVPARTMLVVLYALRGAVVLAFAALPVTADSVLAFSVAIGLTYMATLPPTSALVGQLYGTRNVAVLFGVVMLVHQAGSFLGVWAGGVVLEATGGYDALWMLDALLAFAAVLACLGIRTPSGWSLVGRPALVADPR